MPRAPHRLAATLALTTLAALAPPTHADIIYVDANLTTGANNGTSWADAFRNGGAGLQAALTAAQPGDELWVADGRYRTGVLRATTFTLKNGVTLYGGFAGGEASLFERNPAVNVALLTGDLNNNDGAFPTGWEENAIHVVTATGRNQTAVLDGFTISAGHANGTFIEQQRGGAIVCLSGNPTFRNLVVLGNAASTFGGAVYLTTASPTFTDCRFESNRADFTGGAVAMFNAANPVFTRCRFISNTAGRAGAADVMTNCQPDFVNCIFTANSANTAGAMYVESGSNAEVINCTVFANTAADTVGGILTSGAITRVHNGIVFANSSQGSTTGQQLAGTTYEVSYSCIQHGFAGAGNIGADPDLMDVAGGDFRPSPGSPCIDAGDNDRVFDGVVVDIAGNSRFIDDPATPDTGHGKPPIIDMGAHEFDPPHPCPGVAVTPASAQLCRAQDFVLNAVVGTGDITGYQWRKEGVDLPGETEPFLLLADVTDADDGNYTVVLFALGCPPRESVAAPVVVCMTDADCNDVINSTDVSEFINLWFADQAKGTFQADFDENGTVNSTDVSEFINTWFEESVNGC